MTCVLILHNDWLMKRALAGILNDAGKKLNVCVTEAGDLAGLRAEIVRLGAEMVFLRESTPFAENQVILQLLTDHPNLRVVVVSEESNWLHIFRKEDRLLTGFPDFVSLLQST
jgi:hypothetical protein